MTTDTPECTKVLDCSSLYLDGRLRPEARRRVQRHLRACPSCLAEYRLLGRLSRATQSLPPRPIAADLADSVRARVTTRREGILSALGTPQRRWVAAAAAAVLLGAGWFIGYGMGQAATGTPEVPITAAKDAAGADAATRAPAGAATGPATADRSTPAPVPDDTGDRQPDRQPSATPSFDEPRFVLAARGLLKDLAMIDSVAPHARRPLLAAQLAYFDLAEDATRVLTGGGGAATGPLARFITEFDRAIRADAPIDWPRWHARARSDGLYRRPAGAATGLRPRRARPDRERVDAVANTVGRQLPDAERAALAELLELKHGYVHGRVDASVRYADRLRGKPTVTRQVFEVPAGLVVTETLTEAGLDEDARSVFTRLSTRIEHRSRDGHTQTRVSVQSSSSAGGSFSAGGTGTLQGDGGAIHPGNKAQEMLERMMREMGMEPPHHRQRR